MVAHKRVLGPDDVRRAITRMGHEVIERNRGLDGVVLIGIQQGGVWLAEALGAEIAGTDSPTKIAEQIVGLTQDGEKCTNFADCKKLIADGVDIDYDGISGPLEFVDAGEPSEASILILEFDADGALQVVGSVNGKI